VKQGLAGLKPIHLQLKSDYYWHNFAKDASLIEVMVKEGLRKA